MHKITVLGGGLVGAVIARDLAKDDNTRVTVVDVDPDILSRISLTDGNKVSTIKADLRDADQVRNVIREADAVVGAVPGWLGYKVLEQVIDAGKSFVDISFMPQDPRPLDEAAKAKGVVGLVDFGVAPGMSNVLAMRLALDMEKPKDLRIYVGGLPQVRRWPYEYAAVFSPSDVIEEYTREARLVEDGKVVVREALTEGEYLDFSGVGTLEAFNSDGLRSLMWTLDVPNMKEKTLRYPGHIELMRVLRETGYFSSRAVRVGNVDVRPVDLTLALFKDAWKLPEGEGDLTVMRIEVEGNHDGAPAYFAYDLFDKYDVTTKTTSMARTTGFPCAVATRLLLEGRLGLASGVHFPEAIAKDRPVLDAVMAGLEQRGVVFGHRTERPEVVRAPGGVRRLPTLN
jgi:saccharopine dehydrogenase-like NADP-dependent oxidoreductase